MLIYKHTSKTSGKPYVGQTIQSMTERWGDHCRKAKNGSDSHFHNAIRKYGPGDFMNEELYTVSDVDALDFMEDYFIELYDSKKNGYNLKDGGLGGSHKHVECPNCGHTGGVSKMKSHHFDNCRFDERLNDSVWLEEEYKTKSVIRIGRELNVAEGTVRNRFNKFGIELKGNNIECPKCNRVGKKEHHFDNCRFDKRLNDPVWLEEEYKYKKVKLIAKELDVRVHSVYKALTKFNLNKPERNR